MSPNESITHLNSSGSNYREWSNSVTEKLNQKRLGKYLKDPLESDRSTYAHGFAEEEDLVARSYIKLTIHKDQLEYFSKTQTTYDIWQALKDIHEGASATNLLTLMTEISNLCWTSDIAIDDFTDKYCELVRKLEAAGDWIPESAYATKLLVLMPEQFHNTVLHINRNHSTQPKYKTLSGVITELRADHELQLFRATVGQAPRTNDVTFQATAENTSFYCTKPGQVARQCPRKIGDMERGIYRKNINEDVQEQNLLDQGRRRVSVEAKLNNRRMYQLTGKIQAESNKLHSRANKCVFLGYSTTQKAYKLHDLEDSKCAFSVDVTFQEDTFMNAPRDHDEDDNIQLSREDAAMEQETPTKPNPRQAPVTVTPGTTPNNESTDTRLTTRRPSASTTDACQDMMRGAGTPPLRFEDTVELAHAPLKLPENQWLPQRTVGSRLGHSALKELQPLGSNPRRDVRETEAQFVVIVE
ncbi:hypothetical protein B5M09_010898, partial [Aphanomyces astaci]